MLTNPCLEFDVLRELPASMRTPLPVNPCLEINFLGERPAAEKEGFTISGANASAAANALTLPIQGTRVTRNFKVIDSSNIGMGVSFQGQVLEYVGDSTIPGHVVLRQPPFDANGRPRTGLVTFNRENLEEEVLRLNNFLGEGPTDEKQGFTIIDADHPDAPAAACNYQIPGTTYECRGDGVMWDADHDSWSADEHNMSCPQCGTLAYLQEAQEEAQTCSSFVSNSISGTGETIWLNAVRIAEKANPEAAKTALATIGLVETLVPDKSLPDGYRVVPYLYS